MLKIEVIKFEAQDVITASDAAPDYGTCVCAREGCEFVDGVHYVPDLGEKATCADPKHYCGN